jgi:putative flavoprotein involved in K+ transport
MNQDRQGLEVVVIGGGQAGLAMGHYLQQADRRFVVLEKGEVGETWRTQRWDSFVVNTPNWLSALPGAPYRGPDPDAFYTNEEWIGYLEAYSDRLGSAVHRGHEVRAVSPASDGGFAVGGVDRVGERFEMQAKAVVVASGILNKPNIPAMRDDMPDGILQLHAAQYRSPQDLPAGAVVVVGTGQSGCQIAEDLLEAGRRVFLSASRVGRIPRRYRGRDIMEWMVDTGFWDVTIEELEDPAMTKVAQPQISGVGQYGHTVSLQQLAGDGAVLMGRLVEVADGVIVTDGRLADYVAFADEFSEGFKAEIERFIERTAVEVAPVEEDPADLTQVGPIPGSVEILDLEAAEVGTVIWCTGFTADFGWLHLPVLDESGRPLHRRGVTSVPGLYFLGFPWLHSRKSGVINGLEEDAGFVAGSIDALLDG